jgi:abortive infection bacteriophage resistance protein
MAIIRGWHNMQLDYVLAYTHALKIKRNIYAQKQAGRVWNKHLVTKLTSKQVGFKQSKVNECVFYRGRSIYGLYTDDSILAGPDEAELKQIVEDMKASGLHLTQLKVVLVIFSE